MGFADETAWQEQAPDFRPHQGSMQPRAVPMVPGTRGEGDDAFHHAVDVAGLQRLAGAQ